MSEIAIKTGNDIYDSSNCGALAKICDNVGKCCETWTEGKGLYNQGPNREKGQTDIYSNTTILGDCSKEVTEIHFYLLYIACKSGVNY